MRETLQCVPALSDREMGRGIHPTVKCATAIETVVTNRCIAMRRQQKVAGSCGETIWNTRRVETIFVHLMPRGYALTEFREFIFLHTE